MNQGKPLSPDKVARIRQLLEDTDLSTYAIAKRMDCSQGPVVAINRRFGIREYDGRRVWTVRKVG